MNKDQVKGAAKEAAGRVQKAAGELTGSDKHRAEGEMKKNEGKAQKAVGDVKHGIKKATDEATRGW